MRHAECEQRAEARRGDAVSTVPRVPRASGEEEAAEQGEERDLAVVADETGHVGDRMMAIGESVERLVEGEVQAGEAIRTR